MVNWQNNCNTPNSIKNAKLSSSSLLRPRLRNFFISFSVIDLINDFF